MLPFLKWLTSFDAYGEPVSVSYKGDTTYKTPVGALLTFSMRSFILIFTLMGALELFDYKNP